MKNSLFSLKINRRMIDFNLLNPFLQSSGQQIPLLQACKRGIEKISGILKSGKYFLGYLS
jgi:hypothetical protein